DHEESELLVAEQRTLDTLEVDVRALVDLFQLVEAAFREDRRLVRLDDRVEKAIELIAPRPAQLLQARDEFLVLRRPVRQEIILHAVPLPHRADAKSLGSCAERAA